MHCSALCMCQCECECALAQAVKIVDVLWNCQSHRCAIEYVFQRGLHKYCVSNMHLNHVTQWSFHDENWSIGCRFRQLMALIESVLDRACYRARIVCTAVRHVVRKHCVQCVNIHPFEMPSACNSPICKFE